MLKMSAKQVQEPVPMVEGTFPELNQLLGAESIDRILREYAPPKLLSGFRGIGDLLLCTFFPVYKKPCRAYYEGQGPNLSDLLSAGEEVAMEQELIRIIKAILVFNANGLHLSWIELQQAIALTGGRPIP